MGYEMIGSFSKGMIMMFSGDTAPTGWNFCDGTNGTPDLRDKFIVGAGSTYTQGTTGGEATHILTIDEMPSHNHAMITDPSIGGGSASSYNTVVYGSSHSYDTYDKHTSSTGGGGAHNNLPPYYALAYIMYTGE